MTKSDLSLERIAEMMDELAAYAGQTIVIKIGGNSIDEDPDFLPSMAEQVEFLQSRRIRLVLVHGGGPQIDRALTEAGIQSPKRADGRRPTTAAAMVVVEQVMHAISRAVANALEKRGCRVYTAASANRLFIDVKPFANVPDGLENLAGRPTQVDADDLRAELDRGNILVLHCLGRGPEQQVFNTNADDYAMAVAMALGARRLMLATNIKGVLDANKMLIERLSPTTARALIANGTISGGMIPKVESALCALEGGVDGIVIIDAHIKWSLLGEILTHKGFGTLLARE